MTLDLTQHPCFNEAVRHRVGRIHLPVAPNCNVQCKFCDRKFDCANESRPGVTSAVLSPQQALHYLQRVMEKAPRITVVGIAGPGDPFANPDETMETLRLVRKHYPTMLLCVASNGLNVSPYADELAALAVSHVTLTINAVDPDVGAKVYAWVRDRKHIYRGREGAEVLLHNQFSSLAALKQHGVTVKVNTIIVPGVNDHHIATVTQKVAELGANIANCVPLYPVAETPFAEITPPSADQVAAIRSQSAQYLPQMLHCTRCRADAVGILGELVSPDIRKILEDSARLPPVPGQDRPHVAVATMEGILVNQHLGHADRMSIYACAESGYRLIETRAMPAPGGADQRWQAMAEVLQDCRAVLVSSAGGTPREILGGKGIRVILMEGLIEEGLRAAFNGTDVRAPLRRRQCSVGCAGSGTGCG